MTIQSGQTLTRSQRIRYHGWLCVHRLRPVCLGEAVRFHSYPFRDAMPGALLAIGILLAVEVRAADDAAQLAFFEAKIRPVLVEHCYRCHSAAAGKSESGLQLDARSLVRKGGDRGPAVVPGDPDASVLLTAIAHTDPDLKMPPKKDRLPESVIHDFRTWIQRGAADPREVVKSNALPPVSIEAGRAFWSFRKPVAQTPPVTRNPSWARRSLDHFVLAQLDANSLTPSGDAEPATLLRRLHFDLIGLPPSPKQLKQFQERVRQGGLDAALAVEVDALLASPQFGERWGRHWLDVARYAESSGKEANMSFPYAFRYRDYVIDAVNADIPFDRFLLEQIAGDLLPSDSEAERSRLLIATGFLAIGPKNLDEGDPRQFAANLIDEQIDAVTRAVLANSVACARCHDHKFDPFFMHDYYALAGVFASTKTYFGTFVTPSNRVGGDPLVLPRDAGEPILHASIPAKQVGELKEQLTALKAEKPKTITDALRVFWRSGGIEGQLEKVDDEGRALPLAMGVLDRLQPVNVPLLQRGEVTRPGEIVPRGFPRVIDLPEASTIEATHSGRREFADWLTHPDQPLTARVMVNRIWRHLFGAGLVLTVDNFGFSGERPSHPELLDHLAVQFVADGWSVKQMIREIVLSRTYRQASTYRADAFLKDPDNRLLWRMSKRRLEAEAIRDAMLAASGQLDATRPTGSLVAKEIGDRPISLIGLDARLPKDLDGSRHRSVYLPVIRDRLPDVLDLFDFAEPSLVTGDREQTNVPVQALYLMNSPFVQTQAAELAKRLLSETSDPAQRVHRAYLLSLSRPPDEDEARLGAAFLADGGGAEGQDAQRLAAYCQSLLLTAEFRNLD
jgi:hypothetical protein